MTALQLQSGPRRVIPYARCWNILLRTCHIAVAGVLLGGHVFDIPAEQLRPYLLLTLATGLGLLFLEAYPDAIWFCQGRGVLVLLKLGLLALIPFFWDLRVPLLLLIVVIASVGSHMPSRFRYYSLLHGRILDTPSAQPGHALRQRQERTAGVFVTRIPDSDPHSTGRGPESQPHNLRPTSL